MKIIDVFIGFKNNSLEQIAQLFASEKISQKEKRLFIATCENSVNVVSNIIDGFNAQKNLIEKDFSWLIKTYASSCIRELYDIFDNIKREESNSEIIKNVIDVDFSTAIEHFKIIIGGEDVDKYFNTILEFIESSDKDAKDFNEFLMNRITPILIMFKENNVKLDLIPPEELLKIAQNNYDNSTKNFIKICAGF